MMTTQVRVDQNNAAINFFRSIVEQHEVDKRNDAIKETLKKYAAKPAAIDGYLGITFEDEQHATLFEIEWS